MRGKSGLCVCLLASVASSRLLVAAAQPRALWQSIKPLYLKCLRLFLLLPRPRPHLLFPFSYLSCLSLFPVPFFLPVFLPPR